MDKLDFTIIDDVNEQMVHRICTEYLVLYNFAWSDNDNVNVNLSHLQ